LDNNKDWLSKEGIDGSKFRLTDANPPLEATRYFGIAAVYMESNVYHDVYRDVSHIYSYGEINCIHQPNSWDFRGGKALAKRYRGLGSGHSRRSAEVVLVALFQLPSSNQPTVYLLRESRRSELPDGELELGRS
jgi:hypothetical protein